LVETWDFLAISLSRENLLAHSLIIYDDAKISVFAKDREACLLTEKPHFSQNFYVLQSTACHKILKYGKGGKKT
jgi:hypothetical protein